MKKYLYLIPLSFFLSLTVYSQSSWLRVNQIGYLENDVKVAVWISKENKPITKFEIVDVNSQKVVYTGVNIKQIGEIWAFDSSARLHFSEFKTPGSYFIQVGDIKSVPFKIGNDVYADASEIPLKYMRQQRCGYNPFLKDS